MTIAEEDENIQVLPLNECDTTRRDATVSVNTQQVHTPCLGTERTFPNQFGENNEH